MKRWYPTGHSSGQRLRAAHPNDGRYRLPDALHRTDTLARLACRGLRAPLARQSHNVPISGVPTVRQG